MNSPLHIAVREGNNLSVEVLLEYMTLIHYNCSKKFKSVLKDLVEYKSFLGYLENLPYATSSMNKKQVLKVPYAYSDEIVSMAESSCIILEDSFYKNRM